VLPWVADRGWRNHCSLWMRPSSLNNLSHILNDDVCASRGTALQVQAVSFTCQEAAEIEKHGAPQATS
jgi:hypothetical protein